MRKLLIAALATLLLTGCSAPAEDESTVYVVSGHYYTVGEVITEDGNIWGYISDAPIYNDEPVYVLFDNAKTPDYIYDDAIIGLIGQ